ncbi:MAG: MTAP family purine nucleoside phosphorylase, partial [Verrucomicrobiota bacterium]|nr:MTAP family purine nucleoside phosphorylase [Verrucomicrobiota bacterium]
MIGFIVGSGFYDHPGLTPSIVKTRCGVVTVHQGVLNQRKVALVSRHGRGHERLSNHVEHRANLLALQSVGATAIVSCSVCGVLRSDWALARPILAHDLFFPTNRLPSGEICTFFDRPAAPERGHLIAGTLMNAALSAAISATWQRAGLVPLSGTYGHVDGPRFNTKSEIRALQTAGVEFISQTCGPEAVLVNELELPYALAAFGVDYTNGVTKEPTPPEALQANLTTATQAFRVLVEKLAEPDGGFAFSN